MQVFLFFLEATSARAYSSAKVFNNDGDLHNKAVEAILGGGSRCDILMTFRQVFGLVWHVSGIRWFLCPRWMHVHNHSVMLVSRFYRGLILSLHFFPFRR